MSLSSLQPQESKVLSLVKFIKPFHSRESLLPLRHCLLATLLTFRLSLFDQSLFSQLQVSRAINLD